ncbi:MAG: tRNA lysidine(34) synthetase TilS, partial [Bacteroidota bacterium]
MLEAFQSYIKSHDLFRPVDRLLVAASGGIDSMVLLHLLEIVGQPLEVAHMNFQLRGDASNEDEAFVQSYCESRSLLCHCRRVETGNYAREKGLSTQIAARALRYEWFEELLRSTQCVYLLTAHHADDSVETALFNFTKGTGIAGLSGIKPKIAQVRRPLLFAQKKDIVDYAQTHGVHWREDETNVETHYARNKLRHEVLPVLKEINPSIVAHFDDTSQRLSGVQQLLLETARDLKEKKLETIGDGLVLHTDWLHGDARSLVLLSEILSDFSFSFRQSRQVFEAL